MAKKYEIKRVGRGSEIMTNMLVKIFEDGWELLGTFDTADSAPEWYFRRPKGALGRASKTPFPLVIDVPLKTVTLKITREGG